MKLKLHISLALLVGLGFFFIFSNLVEGAAWQLLVFFSSLIYSAAALRALNLNSYVPLILSGFMLIAITAFFVISINDSQPGLSTIELFKSSTLMSFLLFGPFVMFAAMAIMKRNI